MTDLFEYLRARPYPGRGILLGTSPGGAPVCTYFIMGRSENSRNRVFENVEDGIRTRAFEEAKMTDPSLVIYHPVRVINTTDGPVTIVTNGDQTDTLRDFLSAGKTWTQALESRTFEPDEPNYTPRVSGLMFSNGAYLLSILKSANGDPKTCRRFYYSYDGPISGAGHFISTYEGFGGPLPSYCGEPVEVMVPEMSARDLAEKLWDALNESNRVSLWVSAGSERIIVNKNA